MAYLQPWPSPENGGESVKPRGITRLAQSVAAERWGYGLIMNGGNAQKTNKRIY